VAEPPEERTKRNVFGVGVRLSLSSLNGDERNRRGRVDGIRIPISHPSRTAFSGEETPRRHARASASAREREEIEKSPEIPADCARG